MEWRRGHAIGHGSSATVSIATSLHTNHIFAVKSAKISQARLLQKEQMILSSLSSPYIVGYIGHDITKENNNLIYNLFMEYVPGGTLTNIIRKNGGQLNESTIVSYTRQILLGLDYLHSIGVAHCDIKGGNILICENGTLIADFGCAKWQGVDDEVEMLIGGTPMFMAPEVASGEHQGFPADVWALGCTIVEMATGTVSWPHQADPMSALYHIAFSGESPEIPYFLSSKARNFLSKCFRKDARDRWTVKQLLDHPFLTELNDCHEMQSLDTEFISNFDSPTSILDQGVWNSILESQTSCGLIEIDGADPPYRRIKRLILSSKEPMSTWEENWITIRSIGYGR